MPRAPHSIALLAGRPDANRMVFSSSKRLLSFHALQQPDRDARDVRHRGEPGRGRVPDESVGGAEVGPGGGGGGKAFERVGDAAEQGGVVRGHGSRIT